MRASDLGPSENQDTDPAVQIDFPPKRLLNRRALFGTTSIVPRGSLVSEWSPGVTAITCLSRFESQDLWDNKFHFEDLRTPDSRQSRSQSHQAFLSAVGRLERLWRNE